MNTEFNLIVNLGGQDWQVRSLKERILSNQSKTNEVAILNLQTSDLSRDPSPEEIELFKKIKSSSKIYVIDHGNPNSSNIASGHYQDLAQFFANRINKKQLASESEAEAGQDKKLRFSLIACHAGVGGENHAKSFAGLFHRYLGQSHQIDVDVLARTQVAMINSVTHKKGKLTTSLAHYALISKAHKLGLPRFFYDISDSAEKYHQTPNSKIIFKWDKDGNELRVDAYIDKFAKKTNKLCSKISGLINENNSPEIEEIQQKIHSIRNLCQYSEALSGKEVHKMVQQLADIKKLLTHTNLSDDTKVLILSEIDKLTKFVDLSISESAPKAIQYDANIREVSSGPDYIPGQIKRDLVALSIIELKKMPKTELERPLKKITTPFLQFISDIASNNLRHDKSIERETSVATFIQSTLSVINSHELTKEEKISAINELRQKLEHSINEAIFVTAKISGGLDGINEAGRFGGLTTLNTLFPLMGARSRDEIEKVKKYFDKIKEFTTTALEYLDQTTYTGLNLEAKDVLESNALIVLDEINLKLYNAISHTYMLSSLIMLDELNRENEEPLQNLVNLNEVHGALGEGLDLYKKMLKLKVSIEHSPSLALRDSHKIVVAEIEAKLNELEKALHQLEELSENVPPPSMKEGEDF